MTDTHALDASLNDTFQRKQKSVSIMVIITMTQVKKYNKKFSISLNQSIHRITVSVTNTRTVHQCHRI